MILFPAISAVALGQVAVAADTVVMVQARDGYDLVYGIAAGTFVLLLLLLIIALPAMMLLIRNLTRALDRTREKFLADETMDSIRRTVGHVESMTASLRSETDRVSASIGKVSEQVTLASRRMEERIEEFNALMEVVQEEAESAFIDTAASARGVRKSLGELGDVARSRRVLRTSDEESEDPSPRIEGGKRSPAPTPGAEERPLVLPDPTPDPER